MGTFSTAHIGAGRASSEQGKPSHSSLQDIVSAAALPQAMPAMAAGSKDASEGDMKVDEKVEIMKF